MNTKEAAVVIITMGILKIALSVGVIWGIWWGIRAVIDYAKRPVPIPITVEQRR